MKKAISKSSPATSFLPESNEVLTLAVDVVCAYVSNNKVKDSELPTLIGRVLGTLQQASGSSSVRVSKASAVSSFPLPASERRKPAVPVERSVYPDYIVCLEDGRELKMLKRHLRTAYDMSPAEYKERWGLPTDYPMTAPNYAKKRSKLAREIGLGRGSAGRKRAKAA
ncbi:MAG TPA: MucR family transcriptional regulator, partial [Alphaproteobacteria bacterium]|nr:MucR family transcriptional regulator [Alphaproteobacteria bacterium]